MIRPGLPKLIATDPDGTLVRSDDTVSAYTYEVLREVKAAGIRIVGATGRGPRLTELVRRDIPHADVLVMGHILHDWSLDEKLMLLRKAYEALPPGGALIVYESIIDDGRRANTFGLLMSLNMLIETQDGFDYTGADCQSWMTDIGFQDTYVQPLAGPDSMVVGVKPT